MHRALKEVLPLDPEIERTVRKLRKQRKYVFVEESEGRNSVVDFELDLKTDRPVEECEVVANPPRQTASQLPLEH